MNESENLTMWKPVVKERIVNFIMESFGIYSLLRIRNQNSLAKAVRINGKGCSYCAAISCWVVPSVLRVAKGLRTKRPSSVFNLRFDPYVAFGEVLPSLMLFHREEEERERGSFFF